MSYSTETSTVGFFSPFYYQGLNDLNEEYDLDSEKGEATKREESENFSWTWWEFVANSALSCVPVVSQIFGVFCIAWGEDIFVSNKPAGIGMILKGVLHITNIGSVVLFFTDIAASALVAVVRKVKGVFSNIVAEPKAAAEKVEVYSGAR